MNTDAPIPGLNRQQKFLCATQLILLFLGGVYFFFPKNFLPSRKVESITLLLSAILAVGASIWGAVLFRKGLFGANSEWRRYRLSKKFGMVIAIPFMFGMFNYNALGYTLPRIWTMIHSEPALVTYKVTRIWDTGRNACTYQVGSSELDGINFELCVTKEIWNRLPEHPFVATFKVEQSSLGMTFEEF